MLIQHVARYLHYVFLVYNIIVLFLIFISLIFTSAFIFNHAYLHSNHPIVYMSIFTTITTILLIITIMNLSSISIK